MGVNVIEIEDLAKVYRTRRGEVAAVDGLRLEVPEGGVFGFLGPNGSGKTTTIRCLLGLVRPTRGRLGLLGHTLPFGLVDALRSVGAIVDSPALLPTMTGRENLSLLGAIDGIGRARVDDALDEVGLGGRGDHLVKTYSLGMRQRLALAAALLKDPALLILDEPANGLDPAGIRQVRELLRRLAAEGRTVFVSSHILPEIEQTCDRVAIVHKGRCVAQGSVPEVVARASRTAAVVVRLDDPAGAAAVLAAAGMAVERHGDQLRVLVSPERATRVSRTLGQAGHWVRELRAEEVTLEDLFLELTGGVVPGGPAGEDGHGDHDDPDAAYRPMAVEA